ncbi:MAG: leucine--tRNA ligase [Candidatus Hadarchaeum sp.]|uniref:leucine--tRNA ligase n=1 Tax=Candidatus Hadarchaeum sp. TaxID=2883567 RepID=UPI00317EF557
MVNWAEIDAKWQTAWREARLFESEPSDKPKFYLTVAYPYVSGPMHIGHGRTYTVPDVIARYKRMRGYNVLYPMAYHFTGTPIVGAAKRVARREPGFVKVLTERYRIPPEMLKEFENPRFFANYFARQSELSYRKGMERLGFSIDWRREFTTIDPAYSKFITWQYHKIQSAGLIVKGRHPVKWCPNDGNPVTDHDLLEGEGVEIVEFTLLKYRYGDQILPAATLRPETVFGVTNLWLNPEVNYVSVRVGDESWIVSESAVNKLRQQGFDLGETKPVKIDFNKKVEVPLIHKMVPILPASFVDPDNATGVVGSVPAHAPYDYVALLELQQNPEPLLKHGIDPEEVAGIRPISLIEVAGFGESPAVDVVRRLGIKHQRDPKLEEATAEVYRNEFAKGRMRDWVPKYAGMPVSQAKIAVREELLAANEGSTMFEFSAKPVTCRCGSPVVVRVVEDQWFLNYADEAWKNKARACLARMHLVPPETREQFEHTIDWLHEWPCTRLVGMGTPAPWAPGWIIESLSDSTIYMAYYTIAHILKTIDPDSLSDEVFDYVFYGKGDPLDLSRSTNIELEKLERMRREFSYWYPLDYRMSANELIPNHLTFHIFHHALLFPDLCPRGIVNFGIAVLEGQKMSSSKGNIVAINEAVAKYGADTVRLYLMSTVEPWQDFDWRANEALAMQKNLERFVSLAEEIISLPDEKVSSFDQPARWMLSRLQEHIRGATEALDSFETRKATQHAFFMLVQDVRWFMKRESRLEVRAHVLKLVLDVWLRLLAPLVPHICEELWERLGRSRFVSIADWPTVDVGLVDREAEFAESFLLRVLEDVGKITKVMRKEPKKLCLYVAPEWKWRAFQIAVEHSRAGAVDFGKLMKDVEERLASGLQKADLAKCLQQMVQEIRKMPQQELDVIASKSLDELQVLKEAADFIRGEFGLSEVHVFEADDPARYDPQKRAMMSLPLRPAIYLE